MYTMYLRRYLHIIFAGLIFLTSEVVTAQQPFTLTGTVGRANAPGQAYLLYKDGKTIVTDSIQLDNGQFLFSGRLQEPTLARLIVDHEGIGFAKSSAKSDMTMLYLEPGEITIQAADSVKYATIKGSGLNDVYTEYQSYIKPQRKALDIIVENLRQGHKDNADSATMAAHQQQFAEASKAFKQAQFKFIGMHPESYVSFYLLREAALPVVDPPTIAPLFNALSSEIKESIAGREFGQMIERRQAVSIGKPAPEIIQPDTNGKLIRLSDFRGQYVLIDFWASWCVPCRKENPNVVRAYNTYHDRGFTVLGVSLDRPGHRDAWLKAVERDGLIWTNVSDLKFWENEAAQSYGVKSIPQNFLLDKNGVIVAIDLHGEKLLSTLAEIFDN